MTVQFLNKIFLLAFQDVINDHRANKILNEHDLRASYYHHLRSKGIESTEEKYAVFCDFYHEISVGSWGKVGIKPDLLIISA